MLLFLSSLYIFYSVVSLHSFFSAQFIPILLGKFAPIFKARSNASIIYLGYRLMTSQFCSFEMNKNGVHTFQSVPLHLIQCAKSGYARFTHGTGSKSQKNFYNNHYNIMLYPASVSLVWFPVTKTESFWSLK